MIQCPKCKMVSHNPYDKIHRYCGNCHQFHDNMTTNVCISCKKEWITVDTPGIFHRTTLCPECNQEDKLNHQRW